MKGGDGMNINDVVNIITSVGFPIVAYGALFYYMVKKDKDHKEEVMTLTKAIENNTLVVQQIIDMEELENVD